MADIYNNNTSLLRSGAPEQAAYVTLAEYTQDDTQEDAARASMDAANAPSASVVVETPDDSETMTADAENPDDFSWTTAGELYGFDGSALENLDPDVEVSDADMGNRDTAFGKSFLEAAAVLYEERKGEPVPEDWSDQDLADWADNRVSWFNNNAGSVGAAYLTGSVRENAALMFLVDMNDRTEHTWGDMAEGGLRMVADVTNVGTVIAGVFSFGSGGAAVEAGKQGARLAVKGMVANAIKNQTARTIATASAAAAAESAVVGAAESSARQGIEMQIDRQDEFSGTQLAIDTSIAGAFGAGLGGAFSAVGRFVTPALGRRAADAGLTWSNAASKARNALDATTSTIADMGQRLRDAVPYSIEIDTSALTRTTPSLLGMLDNFRIRRRGATPDAETPAATAAPENAADATATPDSAAADTTATPEADTATRTEPDADAEVATAPEADDAATPTPETRADMDGKSQSEKPTLTSRLSNALRRGPRNNAIDSRNVADFTHHLGKTWKDALDDLAKADESNFGSAKQQVIEELNERLADLKTALDKKEPKDPNSDITEADDIAKPRYTPDIPEGRYIRAARYNVDGMTEIQKISVEAYISRLEHLRDNVLSNFKNSEGVRSFVSETESKISDVDSNFNNMNWSDYLYASQLKPGNPARNNTVSVYMHQYLRTDIMHGENAFSGNEVRTINAGRSLAGLNPENASNKHILELFRKKINYANTGDDAYPKNVADHFYQAYAQNVKVFEALEIALAEASEFTPDGFTHSTPVPRMNEVLEALRERFVSEGAAEVKDGKIVFTDKHAEGFFKRLRHEADNVWPGNQQSNVLAEGYSWLNDFFFHRTGATYTRRGNRRFTQAGVQIPKMRDSYRTGNRKTADWTNYKHTDQQGNKGIGNPYRWARYYWNHYVGGRVLDYKATYEGPEGGFGKPGSYTWRFKGFDENGKSTAEGIMGIPPWVGRRAISAYRIATFDTLPSYVRHISGDAWGGKGVYLQSNAARWGAHALNIGGTAASVATFGIAGVPVIAATNGLSYLATGGPWGNGGLAIGIDNSPPSAEEQASIDLENSNSIENVLAEPPFNIDVDAGNWLTGYPHEELIDDVRARAAELIVAAPDDASAEDKNALVQKAAYEVTLLQAMELEGVPTDAAKKATFDRRLELAMTEQISPIAEGGLTTIKTILEDIGTRTDTFNTRINDYINELKNTGKWTADADIPAEQIDALVAVLAEQRVNTAEDGQPPAFAFEHDVSDEDLHESKFMAAFDSNGNGTIDALDLLAVQQQEAEIADQNNADQDNDADAEGGSGVVDGVRNGLSQLFNGEAPNGSLSWEDTKDAAWSTLNTLTDHDNDGYGVFVDTGIGRSISGVVQNIAGTVATAHDNLGKTRGGKQTLNGMYAFGAALFAPWALSKLPGFGWLNARGVRTMVIFASFFLGWKALNGGLMDNAFAGGSGDADGDTDGAGDAQGDGNYVPTAEAQGARIQPHENGFPREMIFDVDFDQDGDMEQLVLTDENNDGFFAAHVAMGDNSFVADSLINGNNFTSSTQFTPNGNSFNISDSTSNQNIVIDYVDDENNTQTKTMRMNGKDMISVSPEILASQITTLEATAPQNQ